MAANALLRAVLRFVQPVTPVRLQLELMSNEDLDHWLEEHSSG